MSSQRRAVFFMLVSAAAFAGMGAFVKAAEAVPVTEKALVRNLITLGVAGMVALRAGRPLLGRRKNQPLLLAGIGVGAALGQFGLTLAYRYAPAAQVSIYSYTTIVFSALLGALWWGEIPDALSLAGGLLIIAGGLVAFVAEGRRSPEVGEGQVS